MKHNKINLITVAVAACLLSTVAVAQNSNYNNNYNNNYSNDRYDNNDDRYNNNDNRYDNNDYRYGYSNSPRNVYAQVVSVQRVKNRYAAYQRQECWNEQSNNYDNNYYRDTSGSLYRSDSHGNVGATVIGTLVGGVVGNQVGNGKGQTIATIGGAILGGIIGNSVSRGDGYDRYSDNSTNTERRCRTVNDNNANRHQSNGYNVTYRYGNQTYQSFMNKRPGNSIRVAVNVQPIY